MLNDLIWPMSGITQLLHVTSCRSVCCVHLEDADPVLGVRCDVGCQRVAALQWRLRQEALAHILEEDVGKVGRLHNADAAAGR